MWVLKVGIAEGHWQSLKCEATYESARIVKRNTYWDMHGVMRRLVDQVGKLSRHIGRQ